MNLLPTSAIIRLAVQRATDELNGGMPGRVESYDATKQLADVQPLVYFGRVDSSGARVVERPPVLVDVPVLMLGTTRCRTTMALRPGDTVWLMPSKVSLDRYMVQGGELDPQDDRRHAYTDMVCVPVVFDLAHVPSDASTDGTIAHADTRLRLGSNDATDPVVRKSDLDVVVNKLNALIDAVVLHTHLTTTPGNPVSPTQYPAPTPMTLVTFPHQTTPNCSPKVFSE